MKIPQSVWLMHCTNPKCGHSSEKHTSEPDVICQRCGGFVAVTEHIKFIEEGNKEHNDLRSN